MIRRLLKEQLLRKSTEAAICKILLNSLENNSARVYVLAKKTLLNLFKNRHRYRCFYLNIATFLKITFFHDTFEQPLLILQDIKTCVVEVPLCVFYNLKKKFNILYVEFVSTSKRKNKSK